jgi:hypothetical protein
LHWKTWKESGIRRKRNEKTPCRDSAAHEEPPAQAAYIQTNQTYRRATRERQWACHDDLTDRQFIMLRSYRIIRRRHFYFFIIFVFYPSTLVGMYYALGGCILGYDKPNTLWTGPTGEPLTRDRSDLTVGRSTEYRLSYRYVPISSLISSLISLLN